MASHSPAMTFIATHTPPADVAAAALAAGNAAPLGTASHGEVVDWAMRTPATCGAISAFLQDFYDVAPATPAQWARFAVVSRSNWFRGLDAMLRREVAIDILGPFAFGAYMKWMLGAAMAA